MKLLFFSVTKHQYRYFETLQRELPHESRHLFFPTWKIPLSVLFNRQKIDFSEVFEIKNREVEAKYTNSLQKGLYRLLLKVQAPWIAALIQSEIESFDPDIVVLWNGKKFHQAIALEVVKRLGKKALFFENGVLPNTTAMDFKGVNASNSVPRDVGFFKELTFTNEEVLERSLQARSAKKQKSTFKGKLPQKYIFVPFQVAYDTQIIQHSPWIKDMRELFSIIEKIAKNEDINFVFKEHPSDRVSDYHDLYERISDKLYFSSENTQKLIESAEAIITINSSVAIEGLLFGKRVIVLGEAFFAIDGIVKVADDASKLEEIIHVLSKWHVDRELIENFLKYLQFHYLLPGDWRRADKRHIQEIAKRLEDA